MARSSLHIEQRGEAPEDQARAGKGHFLPLKVHPGIGHDLRIAGVARFPRRPFDPGEDDLLTFLGDDGRAEIVGPGLISSAQVSTTRNAPCSIQIGAAIAATSL
jgi:hypothetical protein